MPVAVDTLGDWTKTVLRRMGSVGRGYSAHRRGFVTRACCHAILQSGGVGIEQHVLDGIVRMGGWQAVTGQMTVLRIYANKVLDLHLEGARISLGRQPSAAEVAARLRDYIGVPTRPPKM